MNWDHFQDIAAKAAGIAGALVSVNFLKGSLIERLTMATGGALFSFFAAEYVSAKTSLPEGLAGFLLGLFGMSILSRFWEWLQVTEFDFTALFRGWFKKKEEEQ